MTAGSLTSARSRFEGKEKVQTTNWFIRAAKAVVVRITQRSRVQIPPPQPTNPVSGRGLVVTSGRAFLLVGNDRASECETLRVIMLGDVHSRFA